MNMLRRCLLLGIVVGLVMLPMAALADSITPDSYSATLGVGESVTITKTVTIDSEPPEEAPVDVFFLTDSTGSMGTAIAAVKTSASEILTGAAGLGDVQFGVGEYRDFGDVFTYRTNTDITADTTAVQAGIDTWTASGGDDWYEADLFALKEVADTVSWRDGSTRILVWFGDAPGHDPSGGVTEADATNALLAVNISVEAIDMGYDYLGTWYGLDTEGQATRITDATGGHLYTGVDSSTIVDTISDAISYAIETYSSVALDVSGVPAGVGVSVAPGSYVGDWERDVARNFDFNVTFTGVTAGTYDFQIAALVDGGEVAWEDDDIIVGVPEPGTILLIGTGLLGLAGFGRKRIKK